MLNEAGTVLVGPEGRRHPLPEDRAHGDHDLGETGHAALVASAFGVRVTVHCPGCGGTAVGFKGFPPPGPAPTSGPVALQDLDDLAARAIRGFRDSLPASCPDSLAKRVMEG